MTGATETAHVRGVELAYALAGEGSPFVWGHGLTSSMSAEDDFGLFDWPALAEHRRLVRYDARGHGMSGSTPDPHDLSWHSLALDQLALADHLGFAHYVAGGASMGCATALHAALIAPDRIRGLVLVIPPTAWESRASQTGVYSAMAGLVEAGDHATLLAGAAASPTPDPFRDDQRWSARFPELLATADPTRLARIFRGAGTADLPEPGRIAALTVPTLILAWTGDPSHPASAAARLQELMPHAQLGLATSADGVAHWTERGDTFLAQF